MLERLQTEANLS